MDDKTTKLRLYRDFRDLALRQCREYIARAKAELQWAKIDRKHGYRNDNLESQQSAAYYRKKALWWYARYQQKCQQIAELEN